ncbi:MAG: DNA/RNA non-specific endonuclease [Akkermansiaceae bacterium]|nr:DNA/RNA non-specific endonuclease [Armatimonadota bacterium]
MPKYSPVPAVLVVATLLSFSVPLLAPIASLASLNPKSQMVLGNPDRATMSASNPQHYLIQRPQYALSYNDSLRFPNWVAWHLTKSDVGDLDRGPFQPDPSLPESFVRVVPSDYSGSGYSRGHNCPSKDRTTTRADNDAVFYMSNMTPQAQGMNGGPWADLESYSRDLTKDGSELFIYCGHGFSKKSRKTIGKAKVAVPDFGWKIVVVVPPATGKQVSLAATDPLRRISGNTRVIAVRMPNINTISKKSWREFRTSVEDIESATGLRFFDALSEPVAKQLKGKVDFDQPAPSKVAEKKKPGGLFGWMGGGKKPDSGPGTATPTSATDVWVNTRSGAYWKPGTQYYGKTKQGKYMREADAIKAGHHAAGGQQ